MRVRGIEPPRVILDDLRYGRHPPSKAHLQVVVHDLGLHPVLHEILGDLDVFRSLRNEAAAGIRPGLPSAGHRCRWAGPW